MNDLILIINIYITNHCNLICLDVSYLCIFTWIFRCDTCTLWFVAYNFRYCCFSSFTRIICIIQVLWLRSICNHISRSIYWNDFTQSSICNCIYCSWQIWRNCLSTSFCFISKISCHNWYFNCSIGMVLVFPSCFFSRFIICPLEDKVILHIIFRSCRTCTSKTYRLVCFLGYWIDNFIICYKGIFSDAIRI